MIAALDAEIDSVSNDKASLGEAQRREREAELKRTILKLEREEAYFVEIGNGAAMPRADGDPRALLGLGDDMPEPREQ
jgi:hypothetical protein